jgi:predicted alpha-1,2-mannosidase
MAGELVDGFVQQYRDGGWVSRWSSPGYANLMTGTSSDVSFADAYVKGVRGFDAKDAYDAALRNATVAPPGSDPYNTSVGRKGLIESTFLGYTPSRVSEGVSWALEGYINDFGIANMAEALAGSGGLSRSERERYREEHEYFLERAQNYVNMFDPAIGFFQGRAADGKWKSSPEEYDPRVWGHDHDYTETDGWNFAFHAPQDGRGLANLYGGRGGLADKLDSFFSIPETAKFPGSYGGIIHEMVEARDVRMGQWGFSNQVSHHIPYMYDYAGQPWKAQEKVREVLRRMYIGSEIGQGYAGDEDNGETSAWQLFSALGFYPLQVGSPYYAIGSPLFKKATVHLENGREIVVNAPGNSRRNVYVQSLRVNRRSHDSTYLSHSDLARGARLDFAMGPAPSRWGTAAAQAPPSITSGDAVPKPLRDPTGGGRGKATAGGTAGAVALFDDTSGPGYRCPAPTPGSSTASPRPACNR